ncbi:MAG: sugar phosphate isomerase/epimerase [Clostridia bacterium]|nr:sugar phosphate isomerase/epimerase [Clostridia bacterium]
MKIGVCASPDKLPLLAELGYDYLEANFSWLASLDGEALRQNTALIEKTGVPAEACNIFFRGGMKLYAKDGEDQAPLLAEIRSYVEGGFERAAAWGGKIAVIGSGFVRGIPEGMTREETEAQFARVLGVCGEAAEKAGMRVVVEPLSRRDCNYIHTVAEAADAAKLADHPAVGVLVDFYHASENGDAPETLPEYADLLWHVHYGRPVDRWAPIPGDEERLAEIAEILRRCPNAERISLECNWHPDFDTAVKAARSLMQEFKK